MPHRMFKIVYWFTSLCFSLIACFLGSKISGKKKRKINRPKNYGIFCTTLVLIKCFLVLISFRIQTESRDGTKDLIRENNQHELLPSCSKMWASRSDDEVSREPFCDDLKVKKRKIEITREVIQPFLSKQMRLVDVAKDLGGKFSLCKTYFLAFI